MAAPFLQDPRLTLLAAGFVGDDEAQDGVHLRWSFDPDLSFPREGFRLFIREAARKTTLKVSFRALAQQLQQQAAPAGVQDGVTVHRADGDPLAAATRCDQLGLDLTATPLVLRFRPNFAAAPGLVREVTLFGVTDQGGVFARALHRGRATDCAALGQAACLRALLGGAQAAQLTRLPAGERLLAGRDLRARRRAPRTVWAGLVHAERAAAAARLAELGAGSAAASTCTPFQLTLRADAIDAVHIAGCRATLLGAVWSPFASDESEQGWKLLQGPICLPLDPVADYPCSNGGQDAHAVAKQRLPEASDLPPKAPTRTELEQRLLGTDFDELHRALEQAMGGDGQFFARLTSADPADATTWRYDVVRDALTAAADPYFARILGLYWVHKPDDASQRFDYMVEAQWPVDGEKRRFCWIVFDQGLQPQPALPAPTDVSASARPGSAHVTPDGVLNPCEMDVMVDWQRPTICQGTDPLRTPIAYLVERTAAGASDSGPYALVTQRAFEAGAPPEAVPAMIADPEEGAPRFAQGYFVDRGPGYGLFHYRVLGRDLFGRTSAPSSPAHVLVTDQVAPGPPLNFSAEYFDPDDPEREGSAVLAWANRDVADGAPRRAAVALRWVWPASRQLQFPDLDEFRLYYRPGSLNHVLGRILAVADLGGGEYEVTTDLAPVGPDVPLPQSGVDLGALRSEGEECPVLTIATVGGRLSLRVRANPAAPPLPGPCALRLGRGTSPTATQPARTPYPAFKSFEEPAHWGGLLIDASAPPQPLRVGADGALRAPLPQGLTADDVQTTRAIETQDGNEHWHYAIVLRGLTLAPTAERPRPVGSFGIGAVDAVGNAGRIGPPASIFAILRSVPNVPAIVYPPVNFATPADYHGTSWFTLEWSGVAGVGYLVYRAGDLDLLAAAGIALEAHRALSGDDQRLQLQQLALEPANVEAFRLVTAAPLIGAGGALRHRDALPGALNNRFVYRIRAVDAAGNLAPWPPAAEGSCVVVDLPGVPPPAPLWAEATGLAQGVALRWLPAAHAGLRGYRLYRAEDAEKAQDVRSMTPLFNAAHDEGVGDVKGIVLVRDDSGAVAGVTELAPGERPPGRLVQYVDTAAVPGRVLYYRLVAEDALGNRSPASEPITAHLPKRLAPEPPQWEAPELNPGEVLLRWSAAEDDLECLVLRRSGGALWRALAPWGPPGDYAFADTLAQAGEAYEYRVRVRDRVGHVVAGPTLNVTAS